MKWFRSNGVKEAGFSLVEVLVAITLFVAVSAITGTLLVQSSQATRKSTASATAQSQLLDVVQRMTRDVAVANPITIATATTLETLSVRDKTPVHPLGRSVRTQFKWVADGAKPTGQIRSKTTYGAYGTPCIPLAQAGSVGDMTSGFKVVASDVMQLTSPETLLAYVNIEGGAMTADVAAEDRDAIGRVKINLKAMVKDRAKPLTLTTSMAIRLKPSGSPQTLGCLNPRQDD